MSLCSQWEKNFSVFLLKIPFTSRTTLLLMQQKTKFIPFYPHVRASLPPSSLAEAGSNLLPRRVHILWSDALRSSSRRRTIITSFALLFSLDSYLYFYFLEENKIYVVCLYPVHTPIYPYPTRSDTSSRHASDWVLGTGYCVLTPLHHYFFKCNVGISHSDVTPTL